MSRVLNNLREAANVTENADGTCAISSTFWDFVVGNETYIHSIEVPADSGNDILLGGTEGDVLAGGAGNDRLYGESKITVEQAIADGNGGSGVDTLIGNTGNDYLCGGDGNAPIIAGAGDDYISGDATSSRVQRLTQYLAQGADRHGRIARQQRRTRRLVNQGLITLARCSGRRTIQGSDRNGTGTLGAAGTGRAQENGDRGKW